MKKKALIFGVTGQDGSYLADFLLKKNLDTNKKPISFNFYEKLYILTKIMLRLIIIWAACSIMKVN